MNWRETLEQEHCYISGMLEVLHKKSMELLHEKSIDREFFEQAAELISQYADIEHHQKEERAVFDLLRQKSEQGRILVENGMLVEHQQARYFVKEMRKVLKEKDSDAMRVRLIGYVQAYIDLLKRHIDKENHVAYPYAQRILAEDVLQREFDKYPKAHHEEEVLAFLKRYGE